ncbi:hypothetical protein R1flu_019347 [Riccia fluitans]|uniref:Secreted protein n=1 Tax=Riccia fluitans TaxID=41844 RepID=A0ABD1ZLW1_9MARC
MQATGWHGALGPPLFALLRASSVAAGSGISDLPARSQRTNSFSVFLAAASFLALSHLEKETLVSLDPLSAFAGLEWSAAKPTVGKKREGRPSRATSGDVIELRDSIKVVSGGAAETI